MVAVNIEGECLGYLYRATNKTNGHDYVGSTIDWHGRWRDHRYSIKSKGKAGKRKFASAMRSYGWENFEWRLIAIYSTEQEARDAERFCRTQLGGGYYNMTDGGEGASNPTPEVRQAKSDFLKNVWSDPEQKALRSAAIKAGLNNPETKQRLSEASTAASQDPLVAEAKRQGCLSRWAQEGAREDTGAKVKASWTDERKIEFGASVSARFDDPEYKKKHGKAISDRYKAKGGMSTEAKVKIGAKNKVRVQAEWDAKTTEERKQHGEGINKGKEETAAIKYARNSKLIRINLLP